jgi:hypothetical protein
MQRSIFLVTRNYSNIILSMFRRVDKHSQIPLILVRRILPLNLMPLTHPSPCHISRHRQIPRLDLKLCLLRFLLNQLVKVVNVQRLSSEQYE